MGNDWLFKPANYVGVDELKKQFKHVFNKEFSDEEVQKYINEAYKICQREYESLSELMKRLKGEK